MVIQLAKKRLLTGGLIAACLLISGLAVVLLRQTDYAQGGMVGTGRTKPQPMRQRGTQARMTTDKWNSLIMDLAKHADDIPGVYRAWLTDDFKSAVRGFGVLAKLDPELAMRACAELGFINAEQPIDPILAFAQHTLDGDALRMFQEGIALALAGRRPGEALDLFVAAEVAANRDKLPFAESMLQAIYQKTAAADPAEALSWIKLHQSKGVPVDWRAVCDGMMENRREPLDKRLIASLVSLIPSGSAGAVEDILLGQNRTQNRLENSRALLQCLPDATAGTEARKREAILATLARYTPELFTGGDFTYEHPHDAYAVGQGRSKTSLESDLAWANAIESPEARDYAIKGVVHGLLEEGLHFTSERISLMSPDDPMRRKAVLAMVEWLENNGMTQEAAPWRDQLSEGS